MIKCGSRSYADFIYFRLRAVFVDLVRTFFLIREREREMMLKTG